MLISYKYRIYIWQFFLVALFILIWGQLFSLQVIKSEGLINEAQKQFFKRQIVLRGDIRDRNGDLLVLDVITYDIYKGQYDPTKVSQDSLNKLSILLNVSQAKLKEKLNQKMNTRIFSGVSEELFKKIEKENFSFIYPVPVVSRIYPHKKMAAHVIGFVNQDHKGQHGVEYFHEKLITKVLDEKNNFQIYPKGTDIALTIDSILQEYAEEELDKAMRKSKGSKGAIIILSPKNGEVYAWAVQPAYDPNQFYKEKSIKNWSITDVYEPGSTFKVITVASALENMTIDKDSTFFDPGSIRVGKRIIKNHHKNKPQAINLLELFKQSSNVAAAQVGLTMEPKMFYSLIKRFMIAQETMIDLPGESKGLLLDYKKWKKLELATTAFGQGAVSLTPLQLACAVSTIANHGLWIQPHVLKGIWQSKYMLLNESPYQGLKEQAISEEVANHVSGLLRQSVEENVKAMAYIGGNVPPYKVAGKTGTAQKIRPDGKGYLSGHTVASFVGYFPANDPEVLILVVVDDPKTEGGWGNTVCGPIFNNVAQLAAKRIIENKT